MSTVERILKNETYAGAWHYAKHEFKRQVGRQVHHTYSSHDKDHQIAIEVPAIVGRTIWDATQPVMKKHGRGGWHPNQEYLPNSATNVNDGRRIPSVASSALGTPPINEKMLGHMVRLHIWVRFWHSAPSAGMPKPYPQNWDSNSHDELVGSVAVSSHSLRPVNAFPVNCRGYSCSC